MHVGGEGHDLGELDVTASKRGVLTNDRLTFLARVISAVLYGAMAVGEANTFAPNFAKAKISAAHLMMLIRKEPAIDNLSENGQSPVHVTRSLPSSRARSRHGAFLRLNFSCASSLHPAGQISRERGLHQRPL